MMHWSGTKTAAGTRDFAVTRRRFLASSVATFGIYGVASAAGYPVLQSSKPFRFPETGAGVIEQVIPKAGIPTGIAFKDSIQKLIAAGVIDPDKFRASSPELPAWVERLLLAPSADPIVFSQDTAPYLVRLYGRSVCRTEPHSTITAQSTRSAFRPLPAPAGGPSDGSRMGTFISTRSRPSA